MNRWQEQFDNHPIHATLSSIEELANTEPATATEDDPSEKRRLLKITSAFQETISQLDPEITPFNQLDALNKSLTQHVINHLNAYEQNGNTANLTTANQYFSGQLVSLSYLIPISKRSHQLHPTKKLEALVDSTTAKIVHKAHDLENKLTKLNETIAAQETRLNELDALAETRKQATDASLSEWQKQFSDAQDNRSTEFNSWREKADDKATSSTKALVDKTSGALEDHSTKFKERIDTIISDADNKHQAILNLYELTATTSVAGGYLKNANDEAKQANFWRWASVLFIAATATWLVCAYSLNTGTNDFGEIDWSKLLMTFSLTGVLLWGSAYAAQQSTKHRNSEKKTRWFALEVAAFDPFISSMETEQQNELKKQLSERLFGQSSSSDDDPRVIDEHFTNVLAGAISKAIEKLPKH